MAGIAVSIKKILNLNEPLDSSENDDTHSNGFQAPAAPISKDGTPIWKLLVFDVSRPRCLPLPPPRPLFSTTHPKIQVLPSTRLTRAGTGPWA